MKTFQVNNIGKGILFGRKMNHDPFWKGSNVLTSFSSPWTDAPVPAIIFRAVHDTRYFYFRFDVIDTDIIASRKHLKNKMAVLESDRVEIFFRSDRNMKPYYCLEMDPAGRVLDYKAEYHRNFDYDWSWPDITVRSVYCLNGYKVWGKIPLGMLRSMNLLKDNKIEAGLFRGKCLKTPDGETAFNWISWAKPDSETPDFHVPSAFGKLEMGF